MAHEARRSGLSRLGAIALVLAAAAFFTGLVVGRTTKRTDRSDNGRTLATQRFRPAVHFTPAENWMNDPNGPVYIDGLYHLYYQYNPLGNLWGNIGWGHAVSSDLIEWEEQQVALDVPPPDMAFSGSAVVDRNNSSGLCDGPDCLIADDGRVVLTELVFPATDATGVALFSQGGPTGLATLDLWNL